MVHHVIFSALGMSLIKWKKFFYFFKFSEPQQKVLLNSIKEHAPDSQKRNDFCPTWWDEKVTRLDDFEDLFVPIVCLEEMSLNMRCVCNQDTSAKATSFYFFFGYH